MITLATDFGTPYPAAMKGVMVQETDARFVDIAHDFPRQDIRTAAFWLREVLPYFPPAVHLVVIDPGVGTDRAAIVIRAGNHVLIGPDNGVLVPAARKLYPDPTGNENPTGNEPTKAIENRFEIFEISVDNPASSTFHGRDVFAPVAASVHNAGASQLHTLEELEEIDRFVDYQFPDPTITSDHATGEVLVVDRFGNVITNIPGSVIDSNGSVTVNGVKVPVVDTFAGVTKGDRLVTIGSHGRVELDVNRGRGDDGFGLEPGDEVVLEFAG